MYNPYAGHIVRIDQMFNGDWRVQFVDPNGKVIQGERPSLFKTRQNAWHAAQGLAKWFSVEIEEVTSER